MQLKFVNRSGSVDLVLSDAFTEAEKFWGPKQCGYVTAVYAEVMKFEFKYWTLVENSANQDFWLPED